MNVTRFAIDKTRITYTLLTIVLISGYLSYMKMSRSQDPGFIIRTATVMTYFPGASPARVENLVTDRLEKAIQEIPELDFVNSTSKTGVSIIYVNIKESEKVMRPIWDNLRRKVDREKKGLPEGVIGPFVDDDFGDVYGVIIGITGDGYSYAELKEVADQAKDELLLLENVAKVNIIGAQEERIFLEYSNSRLSKLKLSPYEFSQILASQNILTPGGALRLDEERIFLEPSGNFDSVQDIENSIITLPGKSDVVYLKDMVTVKRGYIDPAEKQMFTSSLPSLGLAISMRDGGNIIALGEEVEGAIRELQAAYPIGVEFETVAFEPSQVQLVISNFTTSLLQSIGVVMLSMILFLGIRTGLVVATLIPTTILMSFLAMSFFNIGLDKISLAALIISLGLLVDNAIVMAESCMVLIAEGKSRVEAAIASANELKIPLLTSSLTTAAAFLPIFLAESATGEYTASLFKVVTIALLSSWVMALTVIPLLCATFLRVKPVEEGAAFNSAFYRFYRKLLGAPLRRPYLSMLGIVAIFFLAIIGFRYVPKSFFPDSNQPMFTIKLELPTGTAIEETTRSVTLLDAYMRDHLMNTDAYVRLTHPGMETETYLAQNPEVSYREGIVNWTTYVGGGAPRFYLSFNVDPPTPGLANFIVNVSDYRVMPELIAEINAFCKRELPDALVDGKPLSNGPPVTSPIEVRVSGKETEQVFAIVEKVKSRLASIAGTRNIDEDWGLRTKKLIVDVNQARARRAGLSSQDIAISLQTMLSGLETTQFREDDKTIPIILRSAASDREDLRKLEQLSVFSQATGRSVPLRQIADISLVWEPPLIKRRDRLKTVNVSSKLEDGVTAAEVEAQLVPFLEEQSASWPPGYRYELGGESESSGKSQTSIMEKLPIAFMIIVLLLVGQFNSMRRPLIILGTLPLGLIGVSIGMVITQAELGFMAFLGIISLSGIVINNAIVLIDRIDLEINENGLSPQKAVMEAAQRRLRSILLTTVTTLVGLLPLWLGGDPMFVPMAITIIFGLAFATALTLGVVPLLYTIFFRVNFKT